MSTVIDLIQEAQARGIRFEVEGDALYASGPVDEELVARLCAHHVELVAHLIALRCRPVPHLREG